MCRCLERRLDANLALALARGLWRHQYLTTAANSTLIDLAMILEGGLPITTWPALRVTSRIERSAPAGRAATLHKVGNCLVVTAVPVRNYVYYVAMMLLELK